MFPLITCRQARAPQPGWLRLGFASPSARLGSLQRSMTCGGQHRDLRENMPDGSTIGRFGSGRAVRRIEDAGLLAGAGQFTDDFSVPNQTCLAFLRSPHAHARIVSIDTAAAAAMPGVVAVLTGADLVAAGVKPLPVAPIFVRPDGSPGATPLRPALAHEVVRFVGEAVVAVVTETPEQAKDALEAVLVDYDELPMVTELGAATAEGAP